MDENQDPKVDGVMPEEVETPAEETPSEEVAATTEETEKEAA